MLLLIAVQNLARNRRRNLLLGSAVTAVTAVLVVLLGLAGGIVDALLRASTTIVTGHVNVGGYYKVTPGHAFYAVTEQRRILELAAEEVPEASYITSRGRGWARLIGPVRSMQLALAGIEIEQEHGFRDAIRLASGRLEDLALPDTILLFEEQAKKLGVKVGDRITLSASTLRHVYNTADVRVVAVAKEMGFMTRFFVFVPNTTLRQLYQLNDDTTGAVFIYLPDPGQVAVVQARLRQRLEDEGFRLMERDARPFWDKLEIVNREAWAGQKLDVTQWEDDLDFVKIVLPALRGLGGFLVFLLLVVIGLGLMNSMWVMIRARTREIGTLRAIGMSRGAVVRMVVAEALALGAVASATGAAAGWVICWAINRVQVQVPEALQAVMMRDTLFLNTDLPAVVASTVLITLFLGLVGLLPALKASRLKPVVALQHTG